MTRIVLAGLTALSLLAACGREAAYEAPIEGAAPLSAAFTGEFDLIDKNGAPVRDEDFEGKVMLVYFGFTNCPDICPGDIAVMSAALNELGGKASEIAPIFISVDPERDTPEALKQYFAFDERLIPLTGSVEAAAEAKAAFKLYAKKETLPGSALGYTVNHQQTFFITDRKGQPRIAKMGGSNPQELAELLRRSIRDY